jgi:PIN domain nuclease of toxin-antitoxin system
MRLLLDTHALVWWWTDDRRLPSAARAAIAAAGNSVFVSAATGWEIATKYRLGKWPGVARLLDGFETHLRRSRFAALPITVEHARRAGLLDTPHRDPFDRMLTAQALHEEMAIVSGDAFFRSTDVTVIWDEGTGTLHS